jgi:hypothetical protein
MQTDQATVEGRVQGNRWGGHGCLWFVVDLVSLPISLWKPKTPGFWVVGDRDLDGFLRKSC